MKHKLNSHVKLHTLAQTGGWCMVDFLELMDGTTMGVTDEGIGLSYQGMDEDSDYDENKDIGFVNICNCGLDYSLIEYPKPTAYHREIDPEKSDLTGWYIAKHVVTSDDRIIFYDYIVMRNGIVITIDDAQITVFTDDTEAEVIGIIERPCI